MFALVLPFIVVLATSAQMPDTVSRETLPSGLHLIVSPRPEASLVAIEIRVRGAGSSYETAPENGLAHAVEHMVFKGTADKPVGTFDKAFESMGGEASAQTFRDGTAFRVSVFPERWKDSLTTWAELLQKPAFRESDWTQERLVILREMCVAQSDTTKLGLQTLASLAYPAPDSYGQPLIGSRSHVEQFAVDDLKRFHTSHYQTSNLTITITGPVITNDVKAFVQTLFPVSSKQSTPMPSSLPVTQSTQVADSQSLSETAIRASLFTEEEQTERKLATVYMGFLAPRLQTDPKGSAACDVLSALLAQGTEGILGRRLFQETQLNTISIATDYLPQVGSALFVIHATGAKRDIGRIEDAIVEELTRLTTRISSDPASLDEEIAAAKSSVLGEIRYRRGTIEGEAQYLAYLDMLNAPENYAEKYSERIQGVSVNDISHLLQQYITSKKRRVSVIGLTAQKASQSLENAHRREAEVAP